MFFGMVMTPYKGAGSENKDLKHSEPIHLELTSQSLQEETENAPLDSLPSLDTTYASVGIAPALLGLSGIATKLPSRGLKIKIATLLASAWLTYKATQVFSENTLFSVLEKNMLLHAHEDPLEDKEVNQGHVELHFFIREAGPEHEKKLLPVFYEEEYDAKRHLDILSLEASFQGLTDDPQVQKNLKAAYFTYNYAMRLRKEAEHRQKIYAQTGSTEEWKNIIDDHILQTRMATLKKTPP